MAKSQRKPLQRYMNKYEGFETQNQNQNQNEDISSYNELTQQYDSIVRQIKTVQQSMNQGSLANISRTGTNNPYRNNTVSVSGAIGNVTGQGVYKWYNSWDTINATQGKNGCPVADPSNMMSINQTLSDPSSAGQTINSSPNLLVGTPMKSGQSCGYEGSNHHSH